MDIKLEDLKQGQWYHTRELDYYFKFSHSIEQDYRTRVYHTRRVYVGTSEECENFFSNTEMQSSIETVEDYSIIQSYFPDEVSSIKDSYSII